MTLAHRKWRILFFSLAALFVLSGLLSGQIKALAPAFAAALSQITENPSNAFLVFMVLVVALWGHQFRKEVLGAPRRLPTASPAISVAQQEVERKITALDRRMAEVVGDHEGQKWVHETLHKLQHGEVEAVCDLTELLDYAVDLTNVHFLDYLIALAPEKTFLPYPVHLAEDERLRDTATEFLSRVQGEVSGRRAIDVRDLLSRAQMQAETELESVPQAERPQNLDPLLLRKITILGKQSLSIIEYLENQRRKADAKVSAHRPKLMDPLQKRIQP